MKNVNIHGDIFEPSLDSNDVLKNCSDSRCFFLLCQGSEMVEQQVVHGVLPHLAVSATYATYV